MKILLVADEESKFLWDHYQPGALGNIDLILSCGDLKADYLSFLVTMGHAPVYYVHGNHDVNYSVRPPEGCECIDDRLVCVNGLRILGLGGSIRYNQGPHQYTEREMARRIARLRWPLLRAGGVDIVVTHSPVRGLGDGDDRAHRGFECFTRLLDRQKPLYLCHGHVHRNYADLPRIQHYGDTTIINACGRYLLEIPDPVILQTRRRVLFPLAARKSGEGR